jgi:primosomal protein N' (replication factor Y)
VVHEEHDSSYKQSERLPYHARDLALVRGREEKAVVLLGSATPSAESLHRTREGRMTPLSLPRRVQQRPLPALEVVDLKRELLDPGERPHVLGPRLSQALAETLDRGEQAILFLNRRGYSSVALCRDCGQGVRCENCSVALTHHLREGMLRCHYCGLATAVPRQCRACGGGRIALFGLGTEKCEEEVRRRFPGARIARLDSDTASGRDVLRETLERFAAGDLDVLVGTQMVTKGHDIPGVTLVGVVLADLGLQVPDFRAAERTFQLLVQVAGRAGRGQRPGTVVVQTFLPLHPAIQAAREGDVQAFMERELQRRRQLGYPPAQRLLLVRSQHESEEEAASGARRAAEAFRRLAQGRITVLGPSPAPLERLRGQYRHQMLAKCSSIGLLLQAAVRVRDSVRTRARLNFDVDPFDML